MASGKKAAWAGTLARTAETLTPPADLSPQVVTLKSILNLAAMQAIPAQPCVLSLGRIGESMSFSVPPAPAAPAGFMRIKQVLQVVPVSRATWWRGVGEGRYPRPFKLAPGVTAWAQADIEQLVQRIRAGEAQ